MEMKMSGLRAVLAASVAAAALAPMAVRAAEAGSENMQLAALVDQVTVTAATRTEKRPDEVPATVSVITGEQIDDQLATDIKDLIRFEPGVSVRNSPARFTAAGSSLGRDGNSGFNIRGLEGNRVLILMDGVRMPDAYSFGAQAMGRGDYLDVGVLKAVEILRGPASALYGSDGVTGAVSFVTKDPVDYLGPDKSFSAEGRVGYASSDDSWAKTAVVAGRNGAWSGFLAYTRRDMHEQETAGSNDAPNINRTKANPQSGESNAILAKIVFEPNDGHRLRLTYDHLDHKLNSNVLSAVAVVPSAVATNVVGLLANDSVRRDRVSLDHLYTSDGFISSAHTTLYWQASRTNQFSAEDRFSAADRTRIGTFDTRTKGASIELHSKAGTGGVTHDFVYGADYSVTKQEGIRGGTVPPVGETFPTRAFPTTDYTLAGAFLQDEIGLMDGKLKAFPAIRYDHYKLDPKAGDPLYTGPLAGQSKSRLSPKIGVLFEASPMVRLFANYGAGFKAPSANQVNNGFANVVSNYRSVSNPNLKPETSRTFEGGVRLRGEGWNAQATAFSGKFKNFITQQQVGGNFTAANPAIYQFINVGSVKIDGIEARTEVDLGQGFRLTAAGAYAKGTSTNGAVKTPLDSIDPLKVVVGLNWREDAGRFGGQLIATHSAGKSLSRAGGTCGATCFTPDAFTIFDATAFWRLTSQATLRAGVFNITDKKYWWWSDVRGLTTTSTVLDAYTQPGRNVGVSLSVKL